jgi:micrococcal nuclease
MHRKHLRPIRAVFTLLAMLCIASPVQPSSDERSDKPAVTVVAVHDGDTVSVVIGQKTEKVRLLGIDAPEIGQRPWGARAKRHLEGLLKKSEGKGSLEFDVERRDKYGRLLAYLRDKDNRLINLEMVENGYAVLFTLSPNVKYADELRKGQRSAREKGLGIWGKDGLKEKPLDYKKTHPR